jgi:hypothetical protein
MGRIVRVRAQRAEDDGSHGRQDPEHDMKGQTGSSGADRPVAPSLKTPWRMGPLAPMILLIQINFPIYWTCF